MLTIACIGGREAGPGIANGWFRGLLTGGVRFTQRVICEAGNSPTDFGTATTRPGVLPGLAFWRRLCRIEQQSGRVANISRLAVIAPGMHRSGRTTPVGPTLSGFPNETAHA